MTDIWKLKGALAKESDPDVRERLDELIKWRERGPGTIGGIVVLIMFLFALLLPLIPLFIGIMLYL